MKRVPEHEFGEELDSEPEPSDNNDPDFVPSSAQKSDKKGLNRLALGPPKQGQHNQKRRKSNLMHQNFLLVDLLKVAKMAMIQTIITILISGGKKNYFVSVSSCGMLCQGQPNYVTFDPSITQMEQLECKGAQILLY